MAEYNWLVNTRLLRLINVSIAVLALILLAFIYWVAYRPLPKVSGKLLAPIRKDATVTRDALGVPHIQAQQSADAYFLEGYAMAQDRLWEMDMLRRFGGGELAEVSGPSMLELDKSARRMRMREIAQMQEQRLLPQERAAFLEFARGVNYFIETDRGRLPLEYSIPGHEFSPRRWVPVDSLVIGMVMFRDLTDTADEDIEKGRMMSVAPAERVHTLFPAVAGQALSPGSNAFAVSGAHTVDGRPLLANDPHLAIRIPSIWYEVHLKSPDMNVEGVTVVGLPGVVIGHNEAIAWGVTNLSADYMDVYREQIDLQTGRYQYQGEVLNAQLDQQVIGVYGESPVTVDTWVTRHGPVVYSDSQTSYSIRWSATDGFGYPFLDIDRAQDWQTFRTAVGKYWGPAQNFVYADREGHIGYQASGGLPIRKGFSGDVPLSGSSAEQEWSGYVPFDAMPTFYDPPGGIVATANQDPFPASFPYEVDGGFADRYRIDQILARLHAKPKLTVPDMIAIQKDVYSAYHHYVAGRVAAAAAKEGVTGEVLEAANLLHSWNGQMDKEEAAPYLAELVSDAMGRSLVLLLRNQPPRSALGGSKGNGRLVRGYDRLLGVHVVNGRRIEEDTQFTLLPRPQVMEGMLRTQPAGWVPKNDWDAWLVERLKDALAEGREQQGSPMTRWRWGQALTWNITHPVGNRLPFLSRFFNIGPVPMSGAKTTVKQTSHNFGPSMRMVVDLGAVDQSVMALPGGESGNVASSHYKDQWQSYYVGSALPLPFNSYQAKNVLHVQAAP